MRIVGDNVSNASTLFQRFSPARHLSEFKLAYTLAGFKVLRWFGKRGGGVWYLQATAVVDCVHYRLGGGTLDTAINEVGDGVVDVQVTYGSRELGGRDFDEALRSLLNREIDKLNDNSMVNFRTLQISSRMILDWSS